MSLKLEKIAAEREKARRKRDEWEERRKEWDRKYHEQENSEICEMVHAQSLTPEQLAVIIQMAQAAVPNPENLKLDEKRRIWNEKDDGNAACQRDGGRNLYDYGICLYGR